MSAKAPRGPAAGAGSGPDLEPPRRLLRERPLTAVAGGAVAVALVAAVVITGLDRRENVPPFRAQACALPGSLLELTQRGYFPEHSGHISILPRKPAYMATAETGWSHSGPWPYLQRIPLVFYAPGLVPATGDVERPVTLADVAPTLATLLRGSFRTDDGRSLPEVARLDRELLARRPPRLVVTVVWDGGGWNALDQWPDAWPNLARLMQDGVSYTNAIDGSSPSVTPAVHTTLGTGVFPWSHGITGIPVRDADGEVVDAFLKGESSRFIQVPALAERWDAQTGNRAKVGMVGYEPWHLGMIGQGAERPGGDRDDAAWLDTETNQWITNPDHYRLPPALPATGGLDEDLERLDAADGEVDGAWGEHSILEDRDRIEETPAFIDYHTRALENLISREGYGRDEVTDLLFTNYKQIDRLGHYFNMASSEVHEAVVATDRALGRLVAFLDEEVGRGASVLVITADHGQQPDATAIDGYGIDPNELERDIDAEFGPVTRAAWPTEVFLYPDALEDHDVTVAEVARFIAGYRLEDNTTRAIEGVSGAGVFDPDDRLFSMAIPSEMLTTLDCSDAD